MPAAARHTLDTLRIVAAPAAAAALVGPLSGMFFASTDAFVEASDPGKAAGFPAAVAGLNRASATLVGRPGERPAPDEA